MELELPVAQVPNACDFFLTPPPDGGGLVLATSKIFFWYAPEGFSKGSKYTEACELFQGIEELGKRVRGTVFVQRSKTLNYLP